MKPIVTFRPLSDYQKKRRADLCKCEVQCTHAVLIVRDEFAYQVCEKGTAEFAYELLKLAGQISRPYEVRSGVWTTLETMELRDYVLAFEGRVPYGALAKFAEMKGKTREQVKAKVTYLKRIGELPYLRSREAGKK